MQNFQVQITSTGNSKNGMIDESEWIRKRNQINEFNANKPYREAWSK